MLAKCLCYARSVKFMPIPEPFKRAYQILRWVSLAGLTLVIVLILWKSPGPDVPNDPSAAARAEQKLEAADRAKAAGLPAHVALDRTELNSYLAQNLQGGGRTPVAIDAGGGGAARSTSAPPLRAPPTPHKTTPP